jgi:DNA-binding transcriptional MerR regulator
MNHFTIRDIENLCGIKAHTLRIWEQRYPFIRPKRKGGNHRFYDKEDLKYLLRIAFLYHHGHKPSALAHLSEKELTDLVARIPQRENDQHYFIDQLLEASLDLNQGSFERVLRHAISKLGFENAVAGVIFPFLEKVGLFWLTGHVVPAQEHFASALIIQKLQVAIDALAFPPVAGRSADTPRCAPDGITKDVQPIPAGARQVLLFTPKGEFHEIPLLYMRYLLRKNGQSTVYFGHNADIPHIRQYCDAHPPTHLYFHVVANLLRCEPDQYLRSLAATFPNQQIVVSGHFGQSLRGHHPNLRILRNRQDMEAFARGD